MEKCWCKDSHAGINRLPFVPAARKTFSTPLCLYTVFYFQTIIYILLTEHELGSDDEQVGRSKITSVSWSSLMLFHGNATRKKYQLGKENYC
jgi:hypothetical protein